ncbi:MAG: CotH kinase family protein [Bacteroidales bacterium]|nr:CotH kinase family protein [Bacteroidales bacterium]
MDIFKHMAVTIGNCRLILIFLLHDLIAGFCSAQPDIDEFHANREFHESPVYVSSNLPIVVIQTGGQAIPDDVRIEARMGVINNNGGRIYFNGAFNEFDGKISIEIRGSSSAWLSDKKSYSLETQNDTNGNLNIPLLGLPVENDWVLVGEYSDKTLIRNALAYEISRRMGRYAGRTRFCELVLNDDYRGVYMLTEKVKRDRNRLDIATLNPDEVSGDDLTGGYIIRIDRPDEYWISPYKSPGTGKNVLISYYYPKGITMPEVQKDYIRNYVTQFENALYGATFQDPVSGYLPYIDLSSFVDYFILQEVSKNIDAYRLSTFMHKDKDSNGGKLTMGPLWDINLGFGNANYYSGDHTYGWVVYSIDPYDDFQMPFWWSKFLQDTRFINALKIRWTQLRNSVLSEASVYGVIDSFSYHLDEAQARNFERWPILGTWIWPNAYVGGTYYDEIGYLTAWITDRMLWMDEQLDYPVSLPGEENLIITNEIYAYPNPFMNHLTIRLFLSDETDVEIALFNNMGEEIMVYNAALVPGSHDLVLQDEEKIIPLKPGIYLYRVLANGKIAKTGKVIKY